MLRGKTMTIVPKIARLIMRFTFTLFLISLVTVLLLRFIPPVASAFMVAKYCNGSFCFKQQDVNQVPLG